MSWAGVLYLYPIQKNSKKNRNFAMTNCLHLGTAWLIKIIYIH